MSGEHNRGLMENDRASPVNDGRTSNSPEVLSSRYVLERGYQNSSDGHKSKKSRHEKPEDTPYNAESTSRYGNIDDTVSRYGGETAAITPVLRFNAENTSTLKYDADKSAFSSYEEYKEARSALRASDRMADVSNPDINDKIQRSMKQNKYAEALKDDKKREILTQKIDSYESDVLKVKNPEARLKTQRHYQSYNQRKAAEKFAKSQNRQRGTENITDASDKSSFAGGAVGGAVAGAGKNIARLPGDFIHNEISKNEKDNSALEAAHLGEKQAEKAVKKGAEKGKKLVDEALKKRTSKLQFEGVKGKQLRKSKLQTKPIADKTRNTLQLKKNAQTAKKAGKAAKQAEQVARAHRAAKAARAAGTIGTAGATGSAAAGSGAAAGTAAAGTGAAAGGTAAAATPVGLAILIAVVIMIVTIVLAVAVPVLVVVMTPDELAPQKPESILDPKFESDLSDCIGKKVSDIKKEVEKLAKDAEASGKYRNVSVSGLELLEDVESGIAGKLSLALQSMLKFEFDSSCESFVLSMLNGIINVKVEEVEVVEVTYGWVNYTNADGSITSVYEEVSRETFIDLYITVEVDLDKLDDLIKDRLTDDEYELYELLIELSNIN